MIYIVQKKVNKKTQKKIYKSFVGQILTSTSYLNKESLTNSVLTFLEFNFKMFTEKKGYQNRKSFYSI